MPSKLASILDMAGNAIKNLGTPTTGTDAATKAYVDSLVGTGLPAGYVGMWTTATAPTGWLLCQGQSLLITDYPALSAAIRAAYSGVDATHFWLPDFRSRIPAGAGALNILGACELGSTAGAGGGDLDSQGRVDRFSHVHWHNAVGTDGTLATQGTSLGQIGTTTATGGTNRLTSPDTHSHVVQGHTALASAISGGAGTVPSVHAYITLHFIIKT